MRKGYLERFVSTGTNKARRITRARIFLQNLWRYSINSYKKVWQKVNLNSIRKKKDKIHSSLAVFTGVILTLCMVELIPNQLLVFILPAIGGFVASIIFNKTITIHGEEYNAGILTGAIFGIIICYLGVFFEWNKLIDVIHLLLSPYDNGYFYSLLLTISLVTFSNFRWRDILIAEIIILFFVLLPLQLYSYELFLEIIFTVISSNIRIMMYFCAFIGDLGNDASNILLKRVIQINTFRNMGSILTLKRKFGLILSPLISTILISTIVATNFCSSLINTNKEIEEAPAMSIKVKVSELRISHHYYTINPLEELVMEILYREYGNIISEDSLTNLSRLSSKLAALTLIDLNFSLNVYNPNSETVKLRKIKWNLYEENPYLINRNGKVFTRYLSSGALKDVIVLKPHTNVTIPLRVRLNIAQSGALRHDTMLMFYYLLYYYGFERDSKRHPMKLKIEGILYTDHNAEHFEGNVDCSAEEILDFALEHGKDGKVRIIA